jgi:hypothetical protein
VVRFRFAFLAALLLCLPAVLRADGPSRLIVSVKEQKLMVLENGQRLAIYPVSTSKFGVGDNWGRMTTPLGFLQVVQKIGDNAPIGGVFHNRRFTGEVLQPNAPGRDPVTTRILWLRGLQPENAHAYSRCIYIHGSPQEKFIGKPASYGCIRMRAADVALLYSEVPIGTIVEIVPGKLPSVPKAPKGAVFTAGMAAPAPVAPAAPPPEPAKSTHEKAASWQENAASSNGEKPHKGGAG